MSISVCFVFGPKFHPPALPNYIVLAITSNAAYAFLLNDKIRSRVERRGRVELYGDDTDRLEASKTVHTVIVIVAVLLPIAIVGYVTTDQLMGTLVLNYLP
eukprot:SAG31_NODE_35623_length_321_cov_0.923423_1_plen_100_part_10